MIKIEAGEENLIKTSLNSFVTGFNSNRQSQMQIYLKNIQFQLIAQALVKENLILREILPIYHIKFDTDEIEVFKLSHFLRLIQMRSVF